MIIAQGAEAIIERTRDGIRKTRVEKVYRHPAIDSALRTRRTRMEARILQRAKRAGIPVPDVRVIDDSTLLLSPAPGVPLKETLDSDPALMRDAGAIIARLHDAGIAHGDLTTSNIMHDPETGRLTIIDFGLSYHTDRIEDRAVDLHVLKQALASKHHRVADKAFRHFIQGYRASRTSAAALERLRAVERRGRNKVT